MNDEREGKGGAKEGNKRTKQRKVLKGYKATRWVLDRSCERKGISIREGKEWWGRRVGGRQGLFKTREDESRTRAQNGEGGCTKRSRVVGVWVWERTDEEEL